MDRKKPKPNLLRVAMSLRQIMLTFVGQTFVRGVVALRNRRATHPSLDVTARRHRNAQPFSNGLLRVEFVKRSQKNK